MSGISFENFKPSLLMHLLLSFSEAIKHLSCYSLFVCDGYLSNLIKHHLPNYLVLNKSDIIRTKYNAFPTYNVGNMNKYVTCKGKIKKQDCPCPDRKSVV